MWPTRFAALAGSIVADAPNALDAAGFGQTTPAHVVPSATPLRWFASRSVIV